MDGALPVPVQRRLDEAWMRRALELAATAGADVPVGAVIVAPGGAGAEQLRGLAEGAEAEGATAEDAATLGCELGAGVNSREATGDPTAHAEVLAVREAVEKVGDSWRLEDCTLYVTLEPCAMCAGAAVAARVGRIVFGAYEPKTGACGSIWDIPRESPWHWVQVRGGVLEEECGEMLRSFFRPHRK